MPCSMVQNLPTRKKFVPPKRWQIPTRLHGITFY